MNSSHSTQKTKEFPVAGTEQTNLGEKSIGDVEELESIDQDHGVGYIAMLDILRVRHAEVDSNLQCTGERIRTVYSSDMEMLFHDIQSIG